MSNAAATVTVSAALLATLLRVAREAAEHHDADSLRTDPETAGYVEARLLDAVEALEGAVS